MNMRDEIVFAMNQALNLARESASAGEVPVGAVVLDGSGNIIGKGANMREQSADPLAHAEVLAMKDAATSRKSWNLSDCTLVVTLEPCPMCAGAVLQTRLKRVIFGRGMPNLVRVVLYGIFCEILMLAHVRKSLVQYANLSVLNPCETFLRINVR